MTKNLIDFKEIHTKRRVERVFGTLKVLTSEEREAYYLALANSVTTDVLENEEYKPD